MWPMLLDLSRDECKRILRKLELEAYASIITAFRAQGRLTKEKKKILQELSQMLSISVERHRAEIRRAVNDEHLNTIADRISGPNTSADWSIEGRRLIPLMPRLVPQTAFTAMANAVASIQAAKNAGMPLPNASSVKEGSIPTTSSAPPTPSCTPTPTQTCKLPSSNGVKTSPVNGSSSVSITNGTMTKVAKQESEEKEDEETASRKRKRSVSLDSSPLPEKIVAASQPVTSAENQTGEKVAKTVNNVQIPASTSLLSQIPSTVRATYGATPIRIALPPTQKQASTISSSSAPKQVVLVPASSAAAPNIFQRSVNIPVVKTVSTTAATVTQKQSKLLSCSQNPSVQGALLVTGKLASSPSVITTTGGQTTTVTATARPKTLPIPRQILRPRSSVLPLTCQNKVQLVGHNFSAQLPSPAIRQQLHLGTPIQVKQVSAVGKTAVQIRHEPGVKIVAQGVPVATSKILPKPTATPIVMVSSTQSGGTLARFTAPSVVAQNTFGTKMVSLSGAQTQVTNKVTTVGNVSLVSRTSHGFTTKGGSPTIIQPPGIKPNVIVVHKAQVWPQSHGQGTTIVVSGGSVPKLSAEAVQEAVTYIQKQERQKMNTPATIISVPLANAVITAAPTTTVMKTTTATSYSSNNSEKPVLSCETSNVSDNKIQNTQDKEKEEANKKNNLLADLIEATGILSDSSESPLLSGSVKAPEDDIKKTAAKLDVAKEPEEQEDANLTWTNESNSQETEETSDLKENSEQQLINVGSPSVNIQDLNLPLGQLDEGQILEIQTQDEEGILSQSTRLTKEMLEELLQQAGLQLQGVEVKNELQNEGNQEQGSNASSVINITKPTATNISVDEDTSQAKNESDLKLPKDNAVDSCMKLVLCEQNSSFDSANIEKTIEEIALKDEVFENTELQRKCVEEEESQCDEQTTVIELLNSEFSVEDDQFVEAELDISDLAKQSPRKEDEDTFLTQTSSIISFPSKKYLNEENVDFPAAGSEEAMKEIFQEKPLESIQKVAKEACSNTSIHSNVRVEPSGLDTSTMNLEDFTSQKVEENVTDHSTVDVSQELESIMDRENTEENFCSGEEDTSVQPEENSKSSKDSTIQIKENKSKLVGEDTSVSSEGDTFKLKTAEENSLIQTKEKICELAKNNSGELPTDGTSKQEQSVCGSEENISNADKEIKFEIIEQTACKLSEQSFDKAIVSATVEPTAQTVCEHDDQESNRGQAEEVVEGEVAKVVETDITVPNEESKQIATEDSPSTSFKENSPKLPKDDTCIPVEETTTVTAENLSKQSECPSESSEEPLTESGNTDTPVRRKRKYPIEHQELPHLTGWARMASGLLEKVCKFRGPGRLVGAAHWFLQPVISAEAPGYYDVVKHPMDFSTIKKKLESGRYQNLKEFHADMMLVRSNCELYNPPGHEARTDCEEVFSFYLQEYNRIVEKWQKSHLLSSSRRSKASKE